MERQQKEQNVGWKYWEALLTATAKTMTRGVYNARNYGKRKLSHLGKKLLEQAKTKEESFEEVGITGDTDTTFLDQLLEQQRTLIAFERSNRNNRNP